MKASTPIIKSAGTLQHIYMTSHPLSVFNLTSIRKAASALRNNKHPLLVLTGTATPDIKNLATLYASALAEPLTKNRKHPLLHASTQSEYDLILQLSPHFPFGPVHQGASLFYFSLVFALMDIRSGDWQEGIYYFAEGSHFQAMLPGGEIVPVRALL